MRSFRQMMGMGASSAPRSSFSESVTPRPKRTPSCLGGAVSYAVVTTPSVVVAPTTVVRRHESWCGNPPPGISSSPDGRSAAPVLTETRMIQWLQSSAMIRPTADAD